MAVKIFKWDLRFDDFAGADAGRADANPGMTAIHHGSHPLQIDVPPPLADVVRVADLISKTRTLAADFTNFRHFLIS